MSRQEIRSLNEAKSLINISMTTGQMLIKNGAEIYRAEDTIERMISSMKSITEVDVFGLNSAIFVSAEYENETITMFKDIENGGVNLNQIDALNTFSRRFVAGEISIQDARNELIALSKATKRSLPVTMFFTGLCSASFAVLFGGIILNYCMRFTARYNVSFFPESFIGTLVVSILALIGVKAMPVLHMDMIIIGAIMPLVPGMAVTNSFRDIISGDYVSGLIGITKGIFVALAIALGVGVILNLEKMIGA